MKTNQLHKDITSAISLFEEFGQRNHFEWKGKVIFENDVADPKAEGLFLARCAKRIAKREGTEKAYNWALKAFSDNVYNRMQIRNKVHETPRQKALADMRLFEAKTLIYLKEKTGTPIKQAYSL